MRRAGLIALVLIIVLVLGVVAFSFIQDTRDGSDGGGSAPVTEAQVTRGEYLARAADCVACHTVKNGPAYAGGLPFKMPFGTIYGSNITPDRETGIGSWSDGEFVRALQRGVGKGGKHLYPAFPYTSYTGMSREDALAIKAYLFSLPAVHRAPPPNSLTFPFNQRWAMRFWNIAFLRDRRFEPDPSKPPEVNRGAYLVEVLGHCGECHTPRNAAFALKSSERLAGANLQGWNAYNITDDALHGIGAWSHEQLQSYLWHGHAEGRGAASGQMAEAVENSLQYLSAEDVRAMVAYLRTVPPKANDLAAPVEPNPPALSAMSGSSLSGDTPPALGRRIFEGACASCHQWNGTGLQTRYAALRGSQTVNDPHGVNLVQVILRGTSIRTAQESASMPGFAGSFSDAEVAAVANFVIDRFGAKEGRVTPEDVARSRNE